ncbi:deoxyribonuclease IV [Halomarina oriensis]|uniref:Probable endonuclease 4 n=1 Tax=Halomarina oriensis TaxID=671145 RepID=A0A6B0GUC0_9EURY|nr:deoxyribonuclease IV [Halomarina oriensis]MWG35318.1 deoxyribonuclease IV [Halomarina oriensis]
MLRVGAHTSISGGVQNAVEAQVDIGGNCGQIFTHSPQVWKHTPADDEDVEAFQSLSERHDIGPWMIHASYLVNLCTPKDDLREKSVTSMQQELDAAERLDVPYVNVHLGAHTGAGVDGGLANAASALDELVVPEGVTLLVESDAGSGTKLGGQFEHLAQVLDDCSHDLEVCVDTAHAFAAGYDLSTAKGVKDTLTEFDDVVGLDHLQFFHLNDSKHGCGTNKDEHAHIGEGEIGSEGFETLLNDPRVRDRPFVLETPTEDGKSYAWNVDRVRELRDDE